MRERLGQINIGQKGIKTDDVTCHVHVTDQKIHDRFEKVTDLVSRADGLGSRLPGVPSFFVGDLPQF